jgi:PIN domain nuclease of toxin-antitoxin system
MAIERACQLDRCYVSVISGWEISMLTSKGRLDLGMTPDRWIRESLTTPGLSLVPFPLDAAIESNFLPGPFHGDSADRMLVATARHMRTRLVTADGDILEYARLKHVNVLEC